MPTYYATPTKIGTTKIANAVLLGQKVNVVDFALGDGGGAFYLPTESMTELRREVWRTQVSHANINPDDANVIDFYAVVPPEVGGFTIREMGLFDDTGALIGVANTPDIQKVAFDDGVSYDSVLIISLAVTAPEVLEYRIDPYVVIATLHDIIEHNGSAEAHQDIRQLVAANTDNIAANAAALLNKANKERPTAIDLPVNPSVFVKNAAYNNHYFKTQEKIVTVSTNLKYTSMTPIPNQAIVATLPTGYRPAQDVYVSAVFTDGQSRRQYGIVFIKGDGVIHIGHSLNVQTEYVYYVAFQLSFLADV